MSDLKCTVVFMLCRTLKNKKGAKTLKKIQILLLILITFSANAQITKGNWLVGGNASFSYDSHKTTNDLGNTRYSSFNLELSPNVGYFFVDKLAGDARISYNQNFSEESTSSSDSSTLSVDPFVRFYFLPTEQNFNIFGESSYKFYLKNEYSDIKTFSVKAGATYFVNHSVGYELALQYLNSNFDNSFNSSGTINTIMLSFGVQIYLEKQR